MPPLQTVFNDTESVKFLEQKIWELVSDEIEKQISSENLHAVPADYGNNIFKE